MSTGMIGVDSLPIAVIPKPPAAQPVVHLMQVNGHSAVGHSMGAHAVTGVAAHAGHALLLGATCLGAAALAVVVTKGVVMGTERLAQNLERLDRELADREGRHADACAAAALWQDVAAQVVDLNARIAAVGAMARRQLGGIDPDLPLPPPLAMGCRSLQEVHDECAERRRRLEHCLALLDEKIALRAERRRAESLPRVDARLLPTAAELLARRRAARSGETRAAVHDDATARIQVRIEEQLDRLGSGVSDAEHARLLETAARALTAGSEYAARPQLDMLKRRVDQLVTDARERQQNAVEAARLLEGIELLNRRGELDDDDRAVVAALRSVVDGDEDLDGPLRDDGMLLARRAYERASRLNDVERVAAMLAELGYDVRSASEGRMTAAKQDWTEHHAEVAITAHGLNAFVVRDRPVAGDDAARRDRERCAELAEDLTEFTGLLTRDGAAVRTVEVSATEPVQHAAAEPAAARKDGRQGHFKAREREK